MLKKSLLYLLLAATPTLSYAGEAVVSETDGQIIVEYTGDANETKAATVVKEKEEQIQQAAADKKQALEDRHAAKAAAKGAENEARRAAEREAGERDD